MTKTMLSALVLSLLVVAPLGVGTRATTAGVQQGPLPDSSRSRAFFVIDIPAGIESAYVDVPVGRGKLTSIAAFAAANGVATSDVDTLVSSLGLTVRGSETGSIDALLTQGGALRVTAQKRRAMGAVRVVVSITLN
jgi:hypothetical protein